MVRLFSFHPFLHAFFISYLIVEQKQNLLTTMYFTGSSKKKPFLSFPSSHFLPSASAFSDLLSFTLRCLTSEVWKRGEQFLNLDAPQFTRSCWKVDADGRTNPPLRRCRHQLHGSGKGKLALRRTCTCSASHCFGSQTRPYPG